MKNNLIQHEVKVNLINTKSYYIVSLVLNNIIEGCFLFTNEELAGDKFIDWIKEFSLNFRDTDMPLALEKGYWLVQNGSINLTRPINNEKQD